MIVSDVPPVSVPVIKPNKSAQHTSVIQSPPPRATEPTTSSAADDQSKDKEKPRVKRVKKQRDDGNQTKEPTTGQDMNAAGQSRPPVICGLVAPSISPASSVATLPSKMNQQQYLISRPLLFNSMPTFSSAHVQPLPRTSMPIFTTPVPASMGLPNMPQGARIVWATRPGGLPIVSTAGSAPTTQSTTQAKSKAQKPVSSASTSGQMDNTALLSLATTALSTAPLPTTPTLSHTSARIPNVSQALMVNPLASGQQALFAGQQFFNPFMQRMPMIQFAPRPITSGQVVGGTMPRPGMPRQTGQLLFAPLPNQTGQPRYLITQPGFLPQRPHASPLFVGHPPTSTMAYAAYPSPGVNTTKEAVKVKKVKTR